MRNTTKCVEFKQQNLELETEIKIRVSQISISELVENLKMMADDNSGKGSPGLFTGSGGDKRIKMILCKFVII